MVFEYKGQKFLTDKDLQITILGNWPEISIENPELLTLFEEGYGRDFLGGDEIISFRQALVAKGMSFEGLEDEILKSKEKKPIRQAVFDKTATGIGRGHSMGGLSGVVLGLHGTKMIDSGLTGLVSSRSLVTSGRRRDVKEEDIVVPFGISEREDLLEEYLEISKQAFKESKNFKERFGKLGGIESFNKALPYNNPADLFLVLPLDTMATLAFEVRQDQSNPNGPFLPREIYDLVGKFPEIAEEVGIQTMFNQRINVPRSGYFHYNVFKDPSLPNYPSELAEELGIMPLKPRIVDSHANMTKGFRRGLANLEGLIEKTKKITDPNELQEAAMKYMLEASRFAEEYNESVGVTILDSLSFRVWSEQKRHATLRQSVESIYSAARRAVDKVGEFWPQIEAAYNNTEEKVNLPIDKLSEVMIIDERLRKNPDLFPYVYHTARQLLFFDKLVEEGIPLRDAAYMIPRSVRTVNTESYDLTNLVSLEMPLRLCIECEPERHLTSWQKRGLIIDEIPELKPVLQPKCVVGYCSERNFCGHIRPLKDDYDKELHEAVRDVRLERSY